MTYFGSHDGGDNKHSIHTATTPSNRRQQGGLRKKKDGSNTLRMR